MISLSYRQTLASNSNFGLIITKTRVKGILGLVSEALITVFLVLHQMKVQ